MLKRTNQRNQGRVLVSCYCCTKRIPICFADTRMNSSMRWQSRTLRIPVLVDCRTKYNHSRRRVAFKTAALYSVGDIPIQGSMLFREHLTSAHTISVSHAASIRLQSSVWRKFCFCSTSEQRCCGCNNVCEERASSLHDGVLPENLASETTVLSTDKDCLDPVFRTRYPNEVTTCSTVAR